MTSLQTALNEATRVTESPYNGRLIQELVTTDSPYTKLCVLLPLEKFLDFNFEAKLQFQLPFLVLKF